MTPRVVVTETPEGTHPRVLARSADQDLAVVFFVARPGSGDRIEADLLAGLGVQEGNSGRGLKREDDAAHAVVWLAAHRTRTVVCSSPQALPDSALDRLARCASAAGADLVLACDHRHARPTAARLARLAPETVPWEQVLAVLPPAPAHDPHVPGPDPVEWDGRVDVPRTDFTAFRHDCRRLLSPEKFARVNALYTATARRVHDRPAEPTVDQVVNDLAADLDACTALDDAVTVLRATQAGLFKRGWILGADLEKTIGRLCNPERGLALSDSEWRLLRAYASPERAAVCALNAAAVPNNDMRRLAVADAADGAWLLQALAPQAAPYVRALRLHRLSQGAAADAPLVTATTAGISALLRDARRDLGLRLANRLVSGDERNVRFRGQLGLYLHDMRQNGDLA